MTDLVEKPPPSEAPSNKVVIGRYVCDPAIFGVLRETPPGRGGEIQLTDALKTLAQMPAADGGGVHGVVFHGRRYDTGDRLDYLRTIVQFACERADVGRRVRARGCASTSTTSDRATALTWCRSRPAPRGGPARRPGR